MKLYAFLLLFAVSIAAKAQQADSIFRSLANQLQLSDTVEKSNLFLHFDKNIYAANENAWFAAYLVNSRDLKAHHTLYVVLVNEMEHRVVSTSKFALTNGFAGGSIELPDSLYSGKYCLVAYTNQNIGEIKPYIFRQGIEILGARKPASKLQIDGTFEGEKIVFKGHITNESNSKSLSAGFNINADGQLYQHINPQISNTGVFEFALPKALALKSLEISGTINSGKEQSPIKRTLNITSAKHLIKLYPNGGRLHAQQPQTVAITAQSTSGKALSKSCLLLEDQVPIVSFTTDVLGNGTFSFTPQIGKLYVVKFKDEPEIPLQKFPLIERNKLGMRISNTLVSDTLRITIDHPSVAGSCLLAIHNGSAMRYGALVKFNKPAIALKIPVTDWEAGLVQVCLFTPDQQLIEKQLVMIKTANQLVAILKADSLKYQPLSQIRVKLKLSNSKGEPVKGIFSFSAALDQTVTAAAKNIEVVERFERFLSDRIQLPPLDYLQRDKNSAHQLIIQENFLQQPGLVAVNYPKPDGYDGEVLLNGKAPKKPVSLMLIASQTVLLQTEHDGKFKIPYDAIRADVGKKMLLSVIHKNPAGYAIRRATAMDHFAQQLAAQNRLHTYLVEDELSDEQRQQLTSSRSIALNEVVIMGKATDSENFYGKANSSGVCMDYVCQFDVLNCPYHTGVKSPQEGQRYNWETPMGMKSVIYHCEFKIAAQHLTQLIATANFATFTPFNPLEQTQSEAMKNTTLHFQALIQTDANGEAIITFNNNAKKGRFIAVVQGITSNEVFSSETFFEVK